MFARVNQYVGDPARLDELGGEAAQDIDSMQILAAFRGALVLGDRRSGRALTITLWATETALLASSGWAGDKIRDRLGEVASDQLSGAERWEVLATSVASAAPQLAAVAEEDAA
jgi:hypothetical protein